MSLDSYVRIKVIGKGSYGEVWLGRHKRDKKLYVLKRIDLQKANKRERIAAEQEAKLLSKLRHPNIVSYKDSFETDNGYLYITMQYCEGGDLYTKLKERKGQLLEQRQIVEWFVQISMALQYMHERCILHRDLKTQNIFLTKSQIIKVGDLGIARVLDSTTDMATTLIGTPYYMSPELFSNKPYNQKSDVWALGCCVYEMTTLKHAFNAKDMNSLVYKILRGKMPAMPTQYDSDLISLIKVMLHQDPDSRPSVNRILRNPFIKRNIQIFLEGTKARQRATSSTSDSISSNQNPAFIAKNTESPNQKHLGAGDCKNPISNLEPINEDNFTPRLEQIVDSDNVKDKENKKIDGSKINKQNSEILGSKGDGLNDEKTTIVKTETETVTGNVTKQEVVNIGSVNENINSQVKDVNTDEIVNFKNEKSDLILKQEIIKTNCTGKEKALVVKNEDCVVGDEILSKITDVDISKRNENVVCANLMPDACNIGITDSRNKVRLKNDPKLSAESRHVKESHDIEIESQLKNYKTPDENNKSQNDNHIDIQVKEKLEIKSPSKDGIALDILNVDSNDVQNVPKIDVKIDNLQSVVIIKDSQVPMCLPEPLLKENKNQSNVIVKSPSKDKRSARRSRQTVGQGETSSSTESVRSARSAKVKLVKCTKPLPPPPKNDNSSLPTKHRVTVQPVTSSEPVFSSSDLDNAGEERVSQESKSSSSSKSSGTGSSRERDNDGVNKSLPNKSARERRRKQIASSISNVHDRPHSAKLKLIRPKSAQITKSEVQQVKSEPLKVRHRQPSLVHDSSSSGDEAEKAKIGEKSKLNREKKEMKVFLSVLDTTLKMNRDDVSDEEKHDRRSLSGSKERRKSTQTAGVLPSSSPLGLDTVTINHRLIARIGQLRRDCQVGIGDEKLKEAYNILEKFEENTIEPKLIALLGKESFDDYAGKIWQLKFCEDSAFPR